VSVTLRSFIRLIHRSGISLAFVVVVVACSGRFEEATPTVDVMPAAGGMVVPTVTADSTASASVAENLEEDTTAEELYMPGAVLVAAESAHLYIDAHRDAAVMSQYVAGTSFTVLEPSGDYPAYPVDVAGEQWIRLRADDGLVGWLPAALLVIN